MSWKQQYDFEEELDFTIRWYMGNQEWVHRARSGGCRK
jgi:dTDP-D-glucose 4,6-dehydratase